MDTLVALVALAGCPVAFAIGTAGVNHAVVAESLAPSVHMQKLAAYQLVSPE